MKSELKTNIRRAVHLVAGASVTFKRLPARFELRVDSYPLAATKTFKASDFKNWENECESFIWLELTKLKEVVKVWKNAKI